MAGVLLGRGSFDRIGSPELPLVNMLYEKNPTNQDDQTSLLQRWGAGLFSTCGAGPIRGIFHQEGTLSGLVFVVSGTSLYKVDPVTAIATQITGTISGTGRVSMAGNATNVLIANDTALYSTTATTLSTVSMPGSIGVSSVAYISGYFLAAQASSHKIFYSAVGGITFAALDFFSAEFAPDGLKSISILADFAHFIGTETTEIWVPTGSSTTPFQRLKGRLFNVGTADKSTVVRLDNTLFWVGNDRIAYRLAGQPTRISDHSIDERLRRATDLRAWPGVMDGHGLWIISTGNETLAYDVTTQQWTIFATYGLSEFRAHLGVQIDSTLIGADSVNGKLWTLSSSLSQDDAGPLIREWAGGIDATISPTRCNSVYLDCTSGSAALDDDPMVSMRFSDDLTKTWSDWRSEPLGRQGQFRDRPSWRRNGLIRRPGRVLHFRTDANCNVAVRKCRVNEPQ